MAHATFRRRTVNSQYAFSVLERSGSIQSSQCLYEIDAINAPILQKSNLRLRVSNEAEVARLVNGRERGPPEPGKVKESEAFQIRGAHSVCFFDSLVAL